MKEFTELTDEELLSLDDEGIERYCKLHAAEEGTPFPGPEPAPFSEQRPAQDVMVFTIGGCSFADRRSAEEVQTFLLTWQERMIVTDYNWQVGSHAHYVKCFEGDLAISEASAYSAERYAELRSSIEGYSTRKTEAEKDIAEWKTASCTYTNRVDFIHTAIRNARSRTHRQEENQRRFDEYLEIANDNSARAWAFFEKANLAMVDFRPVGAPEEVTS